MDYWCEASATDERPKREGGGKGDSGKTSSIDVLSQGEDEDMRKILRRDRDKTEGTEREKVWRGRLKEEWRVQAGLMRGNRELESRRSSGRLGRR